MATNNGYKYDPYKESDAVKQSKAAWDQAVSQKPGEYQSAWQTQLNDSINKILNREKFSYDFNADALYQQYKDQYMLQGQKAMMDTMGQAAAMTGGYGNSYSQSVGQQAYQGYMQQLNDKVPELYQLALSKYQMESDEMKDRAALIAQMENQDYGRYRDQVSDYNAELDRLQNQYNTERDYDYSKWADNRDFSYGQYIDDRNYQYQQDRDKVSDEQWQKQFDEALRQWNFANKQGEYAPVATSTPAKKKTTTNPQPQPEPVDDYYDQLLGAVSTASGAYAQNNWKTALETYKETTAAIKEAYNDGKITEDQKADLMKIATPKTTR